MNEFEKKYKHLDNRKLLKIVAEAAHYDPLAVEAAKAEIASRTIPQAELDAIKANFEATKAKTKERQIKTRAVEEKAKAIGIDFLETISPIQNKPQTVDRKIMMFSMFFGMVSLYLIYQDFGMIEYMVMFDEAELNLDMLLYFMPIIVLPIATIFLGLKKTFGWILMNAFLLYNIINTILIFLITYEWNQPEANEYMDSDNSLFILTDSLYQQPSPLGYLVVLVLLGLLLWGLNQADIRAAYKIDLKAKYLVIGISLFFVFINSFDLLRWI